MAALNLQNSLSSTLRKSGRFREAEELSRQTVALAGESLPRDHWHHYQFRADWGAALLELERWVPAERELLASYRGFNEEF